VAHQAVVIALCARIERRPEREQYDQRGKCDEEPNGDVGGTHGGSFLELRIVDRSGGER
jgi:hypothetical protein